MSLRIYTALEVRQKAANKTSAFGDETRVAPSVSENHADEKEPVLEPLVWAASGGRGRWSSGQSFAGQVGVPR